MGMIYRNGKYYNNQQPAVDLTGYVTDTKLEEKIGDIKSNTLISDDKNLTLEAINNRTFKIDSSYNKNKVNSINLKARADYNKVVDQDHDWDDKSGYSLHIDVDRGTYFHQTLHATKNLKVGTFDIYGNAYSGGGGHLDVGGELHCYNQAKIDHSLKIGTNLHVDRYVKIGQGLTVEGEETKVNNLTVKGYGGLRVENGQAYLTGGTTHFGGCDINDINSATVNSTMRVGGRLRVGASIIPDSWVSGSVNRNKRVCQDGVLFLDNVNIGSSMRPFTNLTALQYYSPLSHKWGITDSVNTQKRIYFGWSSNTNTISISVSSIKRAACECFLEANGNAAFKKFITASECNFEHFYQSETFIDLIFPGTLWFSSYAKNDEGDSVPVIAYCNFCLASSDGSATSFNYLDCNIGEYGYYAGYDNLFNGVSNDYYNINFKCDTNWSKTTQCFVEFKHVPKF